MVAQGEKHVLRRRITGKRDITVTHCEFFDGVTLRFQLIYTGKTERSIPNVDLPRRFYLAYNGKHWNKRQKRFV